MSAKINVVGKTYGQLLAIEAVGNKVTVQCSCGTIKTVLRVNLLAGYTKSCGCLQKQRVSEANTKHGLSNKTPLYKVWKRIRQKCYNPDNDHYKWYGLRGITVDSAWDSFEAFFSDMYGSYFPGATIERKDVNGNYSKENCCWIPAHQQNSNKTNSRRIHD